MTVDIWTRTLAVPADLLDRYETTLSADERERAARYRVGDVRRNFIAARGHTRAILASYTGAAPESLVFEYHAGGKPSLDGSGPRFNISHSGSLYACAVSPGPEVGPEVGIDIEQVRDVPDLLPIARRFYSKPEIDWLLDQPEPNRRAAFFHLWTRKEALIKATGEGFGRGLNTFSVLGDHPSTLEDWNFHSFDPGAGYAGAVVIANTPEPVTLAFHA